MTRLSDAKSALKRSGLNWSRSFIKQMFGDRRIPRSTNGARTPAKNARALRKRKRQIQKESRRQNRSA